MALEIHFGLGVAFFSDSVEIFVFQLLQSKIDRYLWFSCNLQTA